MKHPKKEEDTVHFTNFGAQYAPVCADHAGFLHVRDGLKRDCIANGKA
jgi:hypothetical protein